MVKEVKSQLKSQKDIEIRCKYISKGSRKIYNYFIGLSGLFDQIFVSIERIAQNTGLKDRSVQRCIDQLKSVGLLQVEYRRSSNNFSLTNLYTIPSIVLKHARKLIKYFSYCASLPYNIIKKAYDTVKLQNAFQKSQQERGKIKNVTLYNVFNIFSYIYKYKQKKEHTTKDIIKPTVSTWTNPDHEYLEILKASNLSSHPILDMLNISSSSSSIQKKELYVT